MELQPGGEDFESHVDHHQGSGSGKSDGYQRKRARKGFSKKTGKRPAFARSKSRGDHQKTLESYLLSAVKRVHQSDPEHPMFGELAEGLCRAPYIARNSTGGEHSAKISWRKICQTLAARAAACGVKSLADARESRCWMVTPDKSQLSFNTMRDGRPKVFRRALMVRILCFLKTPTREMWEWLNDGSAEQPFDHYCARGCPREEQAGRICVNGFCHGGPGTRAENEDRKKCTYGAVALCPGHGARRIRCIFTHGDDGSLQKCRNDPLCVGPCECSRPCYGRMEPSKK